MTDTRLPRIEEKLDKLVDAVNAVAVKLEANSVTLDRNTEDVARHIKRSDLLEERIDQVRRFMWMAMGMVALITFALGLVEALK